MRNWSKVHHQKMKAIYGTENIRGGIPSDVALRLSARRTRNPQLSKSQLREQAQQAWTEWNATRRSS
jgi:hypothetical protein